MRTLSERLQDPARSGVYRASRVDPIAEAVRGSKLSFARIALHDVKEKNALLERIAGTLAFPSWFGGNWDVLAFEGFQFLPADDVGVLTDVLVVAAEFWPERGRSFFAVFIDPERTLALADLLKET
jgi:hypothetical protein